MFCSRLQRGSRTAVLLAVLGIVAACSSDGALNGSSRSPTTPPAAGDVASEQFSTVQAGRGGTVVADDGGAAVTIPPGVMQRDGQVYVKRYATNMYDIHISVPWNGMIEISMPLVENLPIVAHFVDGSWRLEDAQIKENRAVATVGSLSFFSDLRECLKVLSALNPKGAALKALKCLARLGIKQLPGAVAKKLINHFNDYDACQPVSTTNWTIDVLEALFTACALTDPDPVGSTNAAVPSRAPGGTSESPLPASSRSTAPAAIPSSNGQSKDIPPPVGGQVPPAVDPGQGELPEEARDIGPIDLDRYCQRGWQLHAVLRFQVTWGWRCAPSTVPAEGNRLGDQYIDTNDACRQQYSSNARSHYRDYHDPGSWFCWTL